jgi:hypothetical protein
MSHNAHTTGKSCTKKQDNTGENYTSPSLVWNKTMLTHANTISIVLVKTEVSTNEFSHDMDDTQTQVFSGHGKFVDCLKEIVRMESLNSEYETPTRKTMWRITCIKKDGRQEFDNRDFQSFMSVVALEIGTMVCYAGRNLDHWWKNNGHTKEEYASIMLASFAEQVLEVQPFLKHQKFLNEVKEHTDKQSQD